MNKFSDFTQMSSIYADLKISTMTFTYQFDTDIYIENVGKYIDLSLTGITTVKIGNDMVRSVVPVKIPVKKTKKTKKSFYNQITLKIVTSFKKKPISVKLFENGSIQMTGCVCIEDCTFVLDQLREEFRKIKGVLIKNKIVPKQFVKNYDALNSNKVQDIKIVMINSNYKIGFGINRAKFYKALLLDNIDCSYEPCIHACVNIKYKYDVDNTISIFVFESGAIIITGVKNRDHITEAYDFTIKKIYQYFNQIITNEGIDIMRISRIATCMDDMKSIMRF